MQVMKLEKQHTTNKAFPSIMLIDVACGKDLFDISEDLSLLTQMISLILEGFDFTLQRATFFSDKVREEISKKILSEDPCNVFLSLSINPGTEVFFSNVSVKPLHRHKKTPIQIDTAS